MKQTCIAIQNSNMNSKMNSPQFAAGVAPRVLGYVLSRMRLAVKSKETGRYEPALICFWWIGPGKKRKLEKDDPMLVLATHSKDPILGAMEEVYSCPTYNLCFLEVLLELEYLFNY